MGFGNSSLFLKIAFVLTIVAFIIIILGVAIPYWFSVSSNGADVYGGLWRSCAESDSLNLKVCSNYDSDKVTDWFKAVQALEIIGLLLIVAALVLVIVIIFAKDNSMFKIIYCILCFVAFGFIIIGIIIYGAEADGTLAEFSGAFAITIIAGIVILVAGVLGLVDWMGKGQ